MTRSWLLFCQCSLCVLCAAKWVLSVHEVWLIGYISMQHMGVPLLQASRKVQLHKACKPLFDVGFWCRRPLWQPGVQLLCANNWHRSIDFGMLSHPCLVIRLLIVRWCDAGFTRLFTVSIMSVLQRQ